MPTHEQINAFGFSRLNLNFLELLLSECANHIPQNGADSPNSAKDTVFHLCIEMQISSKIEQGFSNKTILKLTFRMLNTYQQYSLCFQNVEVVTAELIRVPSLPLEFYYRSVHVDYRQPEMLYDSLVSVPLYMFMAFMPLRCH